jgi:hypothetical protein
MECMAKRKVKLGGQEVSGEEIQFEPEREGWNIYLLQDGTTLKIKTVLSDVVRVDGQYAPNGDPLYLITASNLVASNAPENLKRKD